MQFQRPRILGAHDRAIYIFCADGRKLDNKGDTGMYRKHISHFLFYIRRGNQLSQGALFISRAVKSSLSELIVPYVL